MIMNQVDLISLFIVSAIFGAVWLIIWLTPIYHWQKRKARLQGLKRDGRGKKLYLEKEMKK